MQVFRFFVNGKPSGEIIFVRNGPPIIAPAASRVLHRLPFPILPFLSPGTSADAIRGLVGGSHLIPGLGVLRVETV